MYFIDFVTHLVNYELYDYKQTEIQTVTPARDTRGSYPLFFIVLYLNDVLQTNCSSSVCSVHSNSTEFD